jgi:hypothetical protein
MHVFAAFVPSLSFPDIAFLKMQIQHIAGDSLSVPFSIYYYHRSAFFSFFLFYPFSRGFYITIGRTQALQKESVA